MLLTPNDREAITCIAAYPGMTARDALRITEIRDGTFQKLIENGLIRKIGHRYWPAGICGLARKLEETGA